MQNGRLDQHINLNQGRNTQVNGGVALEMGLASRSGLMVLFMKAIGRIIEHTAKVNLLI
jgi:hypothetical protein